MYFDEVVWLPAIEEKLLVKHNVKTNEVEEVLNNRPLVRFQEKGHVAGEDLYIAYGRTIGGRYLTVFYIAKSLGVVLIISARDMTKAERRRYGRK